MLIRQYLQPGDLAVDATAGWGRDTLFLAECVGSSGMVHAFDVQAAALAETGRRLAERGWEKRVILHLSDHAHLGEILKDPVRTVMFNLGYLPGSDHRVRTEPASTLAALRAGVGLLRDGGVLAVTLYRGHAGGEKEAAEAERYLGALPAREFSVLKGGYINQEATVPYWILVERKGRGG
ncbi:tRNA (mnm(5)s(2)U34)-methyltransferase [Acididesulfobacillus acetoxydans]|uniref:tRNA (mnm(5)s(2)U34)-methyltransferase n=1 Tax=Acididesulfobacillus acetoxydans TaxID=1561005 RepID=UPI001F0DA125|nr:class I SAM-dependent methyltransferase [Acididesulfobacillus acetoxydans]